MFICCENAVRKRRNGGAETAKWWCICGVYMIDFLHFCCQGGEIVVRKRWFGFAISVEIHCVTAVAWGNTAVATLKSAKSYCIFSECYAGFLHFGCQCGCSIVWKWRFDGAEMAVCDINHSFSCSICGVCKYKQPVFRQRYKVFSTKSTIFLIRLHTFQILISCFPILFNRYETIFPDFPTTFRHFPTQFTHFQTRIPPLPHTTTPFSHAITSIS